MLHRFSTTNGDGAWPQGSLTLDAAGNLYGTTVGGGVGSCIEDYGCGTVFKLTPKPDGSWAETVLYKFTGAADGAEPLAGLIFDQAGNLYGTTQEGGGVSGAGTVFKLTPNPDGSWTEYVLYSFCSLTNCSDGAWSQANLIFDKVGNLYGTTDDGGIYGGLGGTVFKLTPNAGRKLERDRTAQLQQHQRRRTGASSRPDFRCRRKSLRHDQPRRGQWNRYRLQTDPERGRKLDRDRAARLRRRPRRNVSRGQPDLRPDRKSLRHGSGRRGRSG